jgi:phosphoenolpyruvate carboxykinase (GTP)
MIHNIAYFPGSQSIDSWTSNDELKAWIYSQVKLLKPLNVYLCTGSKSENENNINCLVASGSFVRLNPLLRPGSYASRSVPSDVARVEARTFICSDSKVDAGPLNNWIDPTEMRATLSLKLSGAMSGRTLFVVPFAMAPTASGFCKIGVQITDSRYVVANMKIMTRMGIEALEKLGDKGSFTKCVHSVGLPLESNQPDLPWPCANEKFISHFPQDNAVLSIGSCYGGNAILAKKSFALRLASVLAREEGWLAEHMLIMRVTSPTGVVKHVCAAFPSQCGKTNFSMMEPTLPGWKVNLIGDDIAWLRIGKEDGKLYAVNPENGIFGVAPGTNKSTNAAAIAACSSNTIFTNCAIDPISMDVWWKGLTPTPPSHLISWLGRSWYHAKEGSLDQPEDAAQANARFTCPTTNVPILCKDWDSPSGVPIDAIIFGGRRASTVPLIIAAQSWQQGCFYGSTLSSETTAAAEGKTGNIRFDPFAMRPFIGYNVGDYLNHWLSIERLSSKPENLPKIFLGNWFQKDADNKFIWPGFGDNIRVLEWVLNQCNKTGDSLSNSAVSTPLGITPTITGINTDGLTEKTKNAMSRLLLVDEKLWIEETTRMGAFLDSIGDRLPSGIKKEHGDLIRRLQTSAKKSS